MHDRDLFHYSYKELLKEAGIFFSADCYQEHMLI